MMHHPSWKQSSQCRSTTAPAGHSLMNIRYIDHLPDLSHDVHLRPWNQSAFRRWVPVTLGSAALSCRAQISTSDEAMMFLADYTPTRWRHSHVTLSLQSGYLLCQTGGPTVHYKQLLFAFEEWTKKKWGGVGDFRPS